MRGSNPHSEGRWGTTWIKMPGGPMCWSCDQTMTEGAPGLTMDIWHCPDCDVTEQTRRKTVTDQTKGLYRVDMTDDNRTWASNMFRFNTADEAEDYAIGLSGRWLVVKGYRVVPADHPEREQVDYEATAEAGFICRDLT